MLCVRFVGCSDCHLKMHKFCVLHMEQIWTEGFSFDACLKAKKMKRKDNKHSARRKSILGTVSIVCPVDNGHWNLLTAEFHCGNSGFFLHLFCNLMRRLVLFF